MSEFGTGLGQNIQDHSFHFMRFSSSVGNLVGGQTLGVESSAMHLLSGCLLGQEKLLEVFRDGAMNMAMTMIGSKYKQSTLGFYTVGSLLFIYLFID